jgi:hypothetical protein
MMKSIAVRKYLTGTRPPPAARGRGLDAALVGLQLGAVVALGADDEAGAHGERGEAEAQREQDENWCVGVAHRGDNSPFGAQVHRAGTAEQQTASPAILGGVTYASPGDARQSVRTHAVNAFPDRRANAVRVLVNLFTIGGSLGRPRGDLLLRRS